MPIGVFVFTIKGVHLHESLFSIFVKTKIFYYETINTLQGAFCFAFHWENRAYWNAGRYQLVMGISAIADQLLCCWFPIYR